MVVAMRPKSDLLNNIETLWNEASMQSQNNTNQQAVSTYQRINMLMQDALTAEQAANDINPIDHDDAANHDAITEDDINALASLVHDAATQKDADDEIDEADQSLSSVSSPPPFDQVMSQMDDVSRLKPPQEDNTNISSVEYDFGQAFTNLVRHVVRDYIHNEVEAVIRNAISSELNAHFAQQNNQFHDGDHVETHDGENKK